MAHYAKVLDGKVIKVIAAEAEFFDTFVDDSAGTWIQTSYNTRGGVHYQPNTHTPSENQSLALRKNFAGVGYLYDGTGFYAPQPFNSWTLNNTTYLWEAPLTYPTDGNVYRWNEDAYQADNTTGWVEVT
tara:strand:+ start:44 stop:430 length:387 start_codon:yes stop_codon:yes gene_type:complete